MCEDERVSAKIVRLTDSQIPAAAATLARAFHDDPLMVYAIPGARRAHAAAARDVREDDPLRNDSPAKFM